MVVIYYTAAIQLFFLDRFRSARPESRLLLLLAEDSQNLRFVLADNSLAAVPVDGLRRVVLASRAPSTIASRAVAITYHGADKGLVVLTELLERVPVVLGALDELASSSLAEVLHDGLDLVDGGSVLGNVELERRTNSRAIVGRSSSLCLDRELLDKVGNLDRGRRAGLMEDSDDVEGFTLGSVC